MAGQPLAIEGGPGFTSPEQAAPTDQTSPSSQPTLSMNALALQEEEQSKPMSEVESALKQLVNFDDISAPTERDILVAKKKEDDKLKQNPHKSKALPPKVSKGNVGSAATLSQIASVKPAEEAKDPSRVMKPPPQLFSPDAANAGALVVHGQGPPPLHQQTVGGFGIPYQMQQQQQQYAAQQQAYGGYAQHPPPQQQYRNY
jgi:hypothetical protein